MVSSSAQWKLLFIRYCLNWKHDVWIHESWAIPFMNKFYMCSASQVDVGTHSLSNPTGNCILFDLWKWVDILSFSYLVSQSPWGVNKHARMGIYYITYLYKIPHLTCESNMVLAISLFANIYTCFVYIKSDGCLADLLSGTKISDDWCWSHAFIQWFPQFWINEKHSTFYVRYNSPSLRISVWRLRPTYCAPGACFRGRSIIRKSSSRLGIC